MSVIMFINTRTNLHFFDMHNMLFLFRFFRLLQRLKTKLGIIHHLDNRRILIRSYLDEIKSLFFGNTERLIGRDNTRFLITDKPYTCGVDFVIDPVFATITLSAEPAVSWSVNNFLL